MCCEGKKELSLKELDKVNGGAAAVQVNAEDITKRNTKEATSELQGKAAGVEVTSQEGEPGSEFRIRVR